MQFLQAHRVERLNICTVVSFVAMPKLVKIQLECHDYYQHHVSATDRQVKFSNHKVVSLVLEPLRMLCAAL